MFVLLHQFKIKVRKCEFFFLIDFELDLGAQRIELLLEISLIMIVFADLDPIIDMILGICR